MYARSIGHHNMMLLSHCLLGEKLLVISCGDRICAYFIIVKTMVIICEMLCEQHLGVVLKFFIQQLGIMITFCKKKVLYYHTLYNKNVICKGIRL